MADSNPKPGASQPRCGGHHLQDSAGSTQGRSDQGVGNRQPTSNITEENPPTSGNNASSAMAPWLEEKETDAPWTPETRTS
ncbi:hypothetical protein EK21DRAFT_114692 [Setomelanomma holmii]|uniref:Uncharacterized protein n=1 Tax=Setomelanomma holmii TaxID=210430 RepID=A0A9P4H5R0_9PLEO|nr:hypothetical protein EK21DRAFT_114692 [Setomelanomma holmii]